VSPVKRGRKGLDEYEDYQLKPPSKLKAEEMEERGSRSPDKKKRKAALAERGVPLVNPLPVFSHSKSPSVQSDSFEPTGELAVKHLFAPQQDHSYSPRIIVGNKGKPTIRAASNKPEDYEQRII